MNHGEHYMIHSKCYRIRTLLPEMDIKKIPTGISAYWSSVLIDYPGTLVVNILDIRYREIAGCVMQGSWPFHTRLLYAKLLSSQ